MAAAAPAAPESADQEKGGGGGGMSMIVFLMATMISDHVILAQPDTSILVLPQQCFHYDLPL